MEKSAAHDRRANAAVALGVAADAAVGEVRKLAEQVLLLTPLVARGATEQHAQGGHNDQREAAEPQVRWRHGSAGGHLERAGCEGLSLRLRLDFTTAVTVVRPAGGSHLVLLV